MGIAVDAVGNAYVTGSTFSTDFPTTVGAYQRSLLGQSSAFVTMVNANGSTLGYSTYLGSDGNTYGQAIAVAGGSAYVGGSTNGSGFPLVGAIQSGKAGGVDAFAAEINPTGSAIFFSTYFGGSAYDHVTAVALNSGNMYIAGSTHSTDLPTAQAYQGSYGGADSDAFLAKIQISTVGLSPGTVTFSTQQVGTTSPPQPVTLTNNGSSSLSIASITFTGSNNGDFAQTNNCGSSVARGASCAINVTFSPTASGTRSATLTVNDNAFGSPHTVSVTGTGSSSTGGSPAASLSLTALAFGNQSLGSTSLAQTVTLSNSGTASLSIDRKSTRLNSSHGYISYAVFCLKKKTLTSACFLHVQ